MRGDKTGGPQSGKFKSGKPQSGKVGKAKKSNKPALINTVLPTVALVGRPNVGKSTLFNRFVGRRLALVHEKPGMTRDRRDAVADFMGLDFRVIDTPGLIDVDTFDLSKELSEGMRQQSLAALKTAHVILFMIDGKQEPTAYDYELCKLMRRQQKPVILVVNKTEGKSADQVVADAYSLGLGDPVPISAEHGIGMVELCDAMEPFLSTHDLSTDLRDGDNLDHMDPNEGLGDSDQNLEQDRESDLENDLAQELINKLADNYDFLDEMSDDEEEDLLVKPLQLAILGRPNVGKSTLVNSLLGEERQLTADMPGVTRDSIHLPWQYESRAITLVDTAGIRRKSRVDQSEERLAVIDAERALRFAEVVVLVIDASIGIENLIEKQDLYLAAQVIEEGRGLVFALNKWDQVKNPSKVMQHIQEQLDCQLTQARGVACVPISALKGKGLEKMMAEVLQLEKIWNSRISTSRLNQWLRETVAIHPPPAVSGRRIRMKYMMQIKKRPPTFLVFGTKPDDVPDSYQRYLVNSLRKDFKMPGVPIRLSFKGSKNPYA